MSRLIKQCVPAAFRSLAILCAGLVFLMGSSSVLAHGGVSTEDDLCLLKIGDYKAHFTGYIPRERATQEFCEDIPVAAESVFVIDFINDELREMETDFRIIRDVNEVGVMATYEDLGSEKEIAAATVLYLEPTLYPRGVLNARYTFSVNGAYIGIMNIRHPETGLQYRSIFPFYVGKVDYSRYFLYYLALFVFCGTFIWFAGRKTFFKVKNK